MGILSFPFLVIVSALFASSSGVSSPSCPDEVKDFRRVGKTRYFINHPKKRGHYASFKDAEKACIKAGMELPKIRHQVTLAILGRQLEKHVTEENLMDTWYWLNASYHEASQQYVWGNDPEDQVRISDILFRNPRPTGVGSYAGHSGKKVSHCLTLALPWPTSVRKRSTRVFFGHQTIFEERKCESAKNTHILCESLDPACNMTVDDPFTLSESIETLNYFDEGNWIAGNRSYIYNFERKTNSESKEHCAYLGLKLMEPGPYDKNLIPAIKLFARELTVVQFWTGLTYNTESKKLFNQMGEEIKTKRMQFGETKNVGKNDSMLCVALGWNYEFPTQAPCPHPDSSVCSWSFMDYFATNCNNYLATICQHNSSKPRKMQWKASYMKDLNTALVDLALTSDFGYEGNKAFLRSKYKQSFGILHCPEGYRMLRKDFNETKFAENPEHMLSEKIYQYDYFETYWLVDDEEFNKTADDNCTVSMYLPSEEDRIWESVKCTEYHFYACELITGDYRPSPLVPTDQPPMLWKEGPQGRVYPLLKPNSEPPKNCSGQNNVKLQLVFAFDHSLSMKPYKADFVRQSEEALTKLLKYYPGTTFAYTTNMNWDHYTVTCKLIPGGPGHFDSVTGCYNRETNLISNIDEFVHAAKQTLMWGGESLDNAVHAVGFAAADKQIGWIKEKVDPSDGKLVKKFVVSITDDESIKATNLKCPGDRMAFRGDGSDTCETSLPLNTNDLKNVLKQNNVDVVGFYRNGKLQEYYEERWYKYSDAQHCADTWEKGGFKKLAQHIIYCVEKLIYENTDNDETLENEKQCTYADPPGYNTLGF